MPMKGPDGAIRGAVTARYDVQADFGELLAPIRFGKSGYVVLVAFDQFRRTGIPLLAGDRVGLWLDEGKSLDGALKTIEYMRLVIQNDFEGFVIVVPTDFSLCYGLIP